MLRKTSFSLAVITTVVLFASVAWVQEFVTDGLIGFWTLDEGTIVDKTVRDVLGKNHGQMLGGPKITEGKINQALDFDGMERWGDGAKRVRSHAPGSPSPQCSNAPMPIYQHARHCD